jgi:tellurite resistance protein TehA-like permease
MYQDVEYWIKLKVDLFVAILLKYWSCFTSVRCLHSINYKKRMQAECKHKKMIFILPFLLLFFCGLQDYTYSAVCFFFYDYMCWISSSNHAPWSCFTSVRCLHSINYKKRQQNCTRMQSNIITFDNWNCLGFYVEDTIWIVY